MIATDTELDLIVPLLREAAHRYFKWCVPDLDAPTSLNRFIHLADAVYYEVRRDYHPER